MKYNIKKAMSIKYKKARKYEKYRDYTSAIYLYEKIIKKSKNREISSPAKVRIAELYLDGKSKKIDNEYARKLLEDAYNQENMDSEGLLGYMCAVGIGGKKDIDKARKLLLSAYENDNPEPMVYIELAKLLPRDKKNKEFKKNLLNSVSFREKIKYNRKKSIDKLNNHKLGKIINYIPNLVKFKLQEYYFINEDDKNFPYLLNDLYEKANKLYDSEKYSSARAIFKRLAGYGDEESIFKYANMAVKGIGGEKDIASAKKSYEHIIDEYDYKIEKLNRKIEKLQNEQKEVCETIISRRKREKNEQIYFEKINELKQKIRVLQTNNIYNGAKLNYGLLMVENAKNDDEFFTGIDFLEEQAIDGEYVTDGAKQLSKFGIAQNKRAKIAIKKLGRLYESKRWMPENLIFARDMFSRFYTGETAEYTSKIVNKLNNLITPEIIMQENERVRKLDIQRSEKIRKEFEIEHHVKDKECNVRYKIGTALEMLGLKRLARSMYESMVERGDFRASYSLGIMKQKGIGGRKDNIKAMKNFSEYSSYVSRAIQEENSSIYNEKLKRNKIRSENNIGNILLEMNDYVGAIERFKFAAKGGLKSAKSSLISLYKEGIWNPDINDEYEMRIVRPVTQTNIQKSPKLIKALPKLKPIAASIAIATTLNATLLNNNVPAENTRVSNSPNATEIDRDYVIGDSIMYDNTEFEVIGLIAYNPNNPNNIQTTDGNNYNLYEYGLSYKEYLQKKNYSESEFKPLYCIKNSLDKILWIDPETQKTELLRIYTPRKKENDIVK